MQQKHRQNHHHLAEVQGNNKQPSIESKKTTNTGCYHDSKISMFDLKHVFMSGISNKIPLNHLILTKVWPQQILFLSIQKGLWYWPCLVSTLLDLCCVYPHALPLFGVPKKPFQLGFPNWVVAQGLLRFITNHFKATIARHASRRQC